MGRYLATVSLSPDLDATSMLKRVMLSALFITGTVHATTYTGSVQQIQTGASPVTSGNIRVSILTGRTASCTGVPGWYSFDLPSVGLASTWVAILLAANAADKEVAILGTGLCDANGVETVSNITALP
jgi:hypothetical protein